MEGLRARKLTTVLVAVGVALAVVCLLVGGVLGFLAGPDEPFAALGLRAIGEGLLAGRPAAWLSLGALLLVATPCLRLIGLLVVFHTEGERRALAACAALLALILAGVGHALV